MLNLVLLKPSRVENERDAAYEQNAGACRFTVDAATARLYLADPLSITCYDAGRKVASYKSFNDEARVPVARFGETVFVAYTTGELYRVDEGRFEAVYRHLNGIVAVEWSPEEETVALVTSDHHLLLLDVGLIRDGQVDLNLALHESRRLAIGGSVEMSWRGDGKFLAVSVGDLSQREILIFDGNHLKLQARAEHGIPLLPGLAWQPNGRHLYAVGASEEQKPQMCLFESNGLAHGAFDLQSTGQVEDLAWSLDSQLLGILLKETSNWTLQVWRRSNWHWYLKYEHRWGACVDTVQLLWDTEEALQLHVLVEMQDSFQHLTLPFMTEIAVSPAGTAAVTDGYRLLLTPLQHVVIPPPLSATAVEFDSPIRSVAFSDSTPEKVAVIMANGSLGLAQCLRGSHWEEAADLAGDDDEGASVKPSILSDACFAEKIGMPTDLIWLNSNRVALFGLGVGEFRTRSVMAVATLEEEENGFRCIWDGIQPLDFTLLKSMGVYKHHVYLQSVEGEIYAAAISPLSPPVLCPQLSFPAACPCGVLGEGRNGEVCLVGKAVNGRVYRGKTLLMERVSSMIQHRDLRGQSYLLLTDRDNRLHVKPFRDLLRIEKPSENGHREGMARPGRRSGATAGMHAAMTPSIPHSASLFERPVEQGAYLIASPPGSVDVVFQMPRGNLEVVGLRLFVLQEILQALESRDFASAWHLCALHRVDLNVLVDYKWPQFLSDTDHFLTSVGAPDEVCALLIALQRGNLFEKDSPYWSCLPDPDTAQPAETGPDKITDVCHALRRAMRDVNEDLYCKAIVLSYARCDPPDLENALVCIKALREKEIQQGAEMTEDTISYAGEALKHLMLYIETAELYRVALGLYDLGLAYMVVTHAQRDPGEYLIELDQFAALEPESYRRAVIDRHLHRFSHALRHLLESGSDHLEEAMDLAAEHHLFHELVSQMQGTEAERREVLRNYGHWLKERGMQEDAGAAFLAAEELSLAMDAFQSCGEWQMTFILANRLELPHDEIQDLAVEILEELKSMERLADAAAVCLEYLDDPETAIQLLTDARFAHRHPVPRRRPASRQWREAVRLCHRHGKTALIDALIAPSAAATAAAFIEEFSAASASIHKYSTRLKEVHSKRRAMDATIGQTGGEMEEGTASTVAGLSIYTEKTQTGKTAGGSSAALTVGGKKPRNRPKRQKKLKIKQGSPEEESALIEHLHGLKPDPRVMEDVSQLNLFLVFMGYLQDARKLQSTLDTLIKTHSTAAADLPSASIEARLTNEATRVRWKYDILRSSA